ncbi:MAG: HNH endonuclease [Candidatus Flexifilum sp.]|jgi:hypothetical protein
MAHIPAALRDQVLARARGLCEYCHTRQAIVVAVEIDHIIPESAGGATILDNLCLTCVGCNRFKGDATAAVDPLTGREVMLFHPTRERWSEHFIWSSTGLVLLGQTPSARATIQRLKINREALLTARSLWRRAGWHPPKDDPIQP